MKIVESKQPVFVNGTDLRSGQVYRHMHTGEIVLALGNRQATYLHCKQESRIGDIIQPVSGPEWEILNVELHTL